MMGRGFRLRPFYFVCTRFDSIAKPVIEKKKVSLSRSCLQPDQAYYSCDSQ